MADASIANTFTPAKHDVQINILYFISLAFALSVSSVCILGKQWIREYEKDVVGTPCDAVRVRQMRYDSLETWKVPQIIAALPLILIVALLLFFTGLLVQLWNVSEHTTAIAVSTIVAMTAFLVMVTTAAPAYCGNWHNRTSFVPFRSPQAWLIFVVYRQCQHWMHAVHVFFRHPYYGNLPPVPILSNWSAFDLHFLNIERENWFQHEFSSIHRVLRWVYHTLSTSDIMETCVLWCLQSPEALPIGLMDDDNQLSSYVIAQEDSTGPSHWPDRAWYDLTCERLGRQWIGALVGRYQVEMLIRTSNQAIDFLSEDWGKAKDQIDNCCYRLLHSHALFDYYVPTEDTQCRSVSLVTHKRANPRIENDGLRFHADQYDIQNQISLMLQRLLSAKLDSFPSHPQPPPDFKRVFSLLWRVSKGTDSTASLARGVTREIIVQGIPRILRKRKSINLVLALAQDILTWPWDHFNLADPEKPFVTLDKVLAEIWSEREGVEGRTEENMLKWESLRSSVWVHCYVNLASVNGPFPTWNPSPARTGPSRVDKLLSVLRIDRVCGSYNFNVLSYQPRTA